MMFTLMKKAQDNLEKKLEMVSTKEAKEVSYLRAVLKAAITALCVMQNYPQATTAVMLFLTLRYIAFPMFWHKPVQVGMAVLAVAVTKWLLDYFDREK